MNNGFGKIFWTLRRNDKIKEGDYHADGTPQLAGAPACQPRPAPSSRPAQARERSNMQTEERPWEATWELEPPHFEAGDTSPRGRITLAVGEIVEIKGARFRVHSIGRKMIVLAGLPGTRVGG